MSNIVYIATSLDGYIADKENKIDWLHETPNPEGSDMGFSEFMERIEALLMGRNTLEMVLSFDCDWPYAKPVFVLSTTMNSVPKGYEDKVFLVKGALKNVFKQINDKGFENLYIDGGMTIQSCLKEDLIDEINITTIPVLLGGGISLFGELDAPLKFQHSKTEKHLDALVSNTYLRVRESQ